jgi:hypothetical protein
MVRKRKHQSNNPAERDVYLFMKQGRVQHYQEDGVTMMLLAHDFDMAKKFADAKLNDVNGKVSIVRVGDVEGETLEQHLQMAHEDGCDGIGLLRTAEGELAYRPFEENE